MIKVNLLKQPKQSQVNLGGEMETNAQTRAPGLDPASRNKIIIFALPFLAIFAWHTYNINEFNGDLKLQNNRLTDLKTKTDAIRPQIDQIQKYIDDKKKLSEEIEVLKGVSLKRYRTLKIFDAIQNLIPNKAWLTKLDIVDEQVSLEGNSSEDIALSSFMETLEQSVYFKEINLVDSHDTKLEKGDLVKFFKIKMLLEKL